MCTKNDLFTLLSILLLTALQLSVRAQGDCQNQELSGTYTLIEDSEGISPKEGAVITLNLSGSDANIQAKMGRDGINSSGEFHACNNLITISFNDFDFSANQLQFQMNANGLVLPFQVFGGKGGTSKWEKISDKQQTEEAAETDPFVNNNESSLVDDFGDNQNNANNQTRNTEHPNNGNLAKFGSNSRSINNNDNIENNESNNSYTGDYIGTGWGWEVRFKHTSGDFVSQFTGTKKNELPFDGEKIIMSLMVEHATKFKLHIDENNQVTGEGEIVYNVIPNLCGLAVLTEQVNAAVNLMGEFAFFFDLGANIGKETAKSFTGKFLGMQGNLAKSVKIATSAGGSLINEYIGMKLPEKMKALDLEGQQNNALCNCAAGQAAVTGGTNVGPATIKDMLKTTGVDIAKTLFMDMATGTLPVGMVLSIPGVTQIQYEYKGLKNGPETRKFKVKGYLEGDELFLQMDGDVFDGPKNLTIQYTVNYKTENPTFPTWSPFLKDKAQMMPANSEAELYEQLVTTKTITYTDAVTGDKKTMEVPVVNTIRKDEVLPFPFAIFREAGKQRNGVKVWHEYEYNWSVFKIPNDN